jgi:FixJ family two-component response regulator
VRAGAFDYISKPFVIADVKRIVDRARARRAGRTVAETPTGPSAA